MSLKLSGRFVRYCNICKRALDNPADPTTKDCGGDCLRCMAEIGDDPECQAELRRLQGDPA